MAREPVAGIMDRNDRDWETGEQISEIWLKGDGTVIATNELATWQLNPDGVINWFNDNGTITMLANGNVDINGNIFEAGGKIVTAGAVDIAGILTLPNGTNIDLSAGGDVKFTATTYLTHKHTETGTVTSTPI